MRKGLGLFAVVSLGMLVVVAVPRITEALASAQIFRVVDVSVEGARYLTQAELIEAAQLPAGASVWDDLEPLPLRLSSHPMVGQVRVRRRLPGRLIFQVQEREPVALLPTPTLTPIDEEGRPLPISPAGRRMDLPLVQPRRDDPITGPELTPAQLHGLTSELARLGEFDPAVLASVSEVALDSWGDILLHFSEPRVTLRYRAPLIPVRLNEGLRVLTDALERQPDRKLVSVDLRFADQVVVKFSDSPER